MKYFWLGVLSLLWACGGPGMHKDPEITLSEDSLNMVRERLETYKTVPLTADLSHLSSDEKEMLRLFIQAAQIMDSLFWEQAYGEFGRLLARISQPELKRFVEINYGPWDRLNDNEPFIPGFGVKPPGANLYPADLTRELFDAWNHPDKNHAYSIVRYLSNGELQVIPYSEAFAGPLKRAADLLLKAAELTDDARLRKYLQLRAEAFLSDDYFASDMAWMEKGGNLELVIGPIENYEDKLSGARNAFEAYVLIKDPEWSSRLEKFTPLLPVLQENLPVPAAYRPKLEDSGSEINAYDVLYYAGDCNAGSKTIAINLPNDEQIQVQKGTRRLQLKNVIRAKYEAIMEPITRALIVEDQAGLVNFDAFFSTIMFHEVAHGLGVKTLIDGSGKTVTEALGPHYAAIEEGKADILGLYMIRQLHKMGEIGGHMEEYYVTFMAGIFRSVRFGVASAHGKANMVRFNYFLKEGAFSRDPETGKYRVHPEKMEQAMNGLSTLLLTIQGNGDAAAAQKLLEESGIIGSELRADLDRLNELKIPVDIVFDQGFHQLGL